MHNRFFVSFRYQHHSGQSGYDRFANFLGSTIEPTDYKYDLAHLAAKQFFRGLSAFSGCNEYNRLDVAREVAVFTHMRKTRNNIYHFLYAEKSLCYLSLFNGWRGHKIIGSFHQCPFRYADHFRSTRHFRRLEHAVVVSRKQIPFMEGIVGVGKVTFVPYAVDTDYFVPSLRDPNRRLRCTCAGEHLRDFDTLKSLIVSIQMKRADVDFYVIGGRKSCEHDFAGLRNVYWMQGVPDEEYRNILQQTDILTLPLIDSTSVTAVLEATACGVPVITNKGGVEDYLNTDCGLVLEKGDVRGMAFATEELLADPQKLSKMRLAARKSALSFSWEESSKAMFRLYDQIRRNC
jgi:glycosyltransferase involved in cell wall biosynthesis